jgi:hypothetical protein
MTKLNTNIILYRNILDIYFLTISIQSNFKFTIKFMRDSIHMYGSYKFNVNFKVRWIKDKFPFV